MNTATGEPMNGNSALESIITRVNELGLHMGVVDGDLVLEGELGLLSPAERETISRLKSDLIAHLAAPREHVAILCKHRKPDGRACGHIVTYQRPTGKVAWCQTCYGEKAASKSETASHAAPAEPCYCCKHTDWWVSIHGNRICRVCHPPAYPELENKDGAAAIQTADPNSNPDAESIVPNPAHVVLPLRRPKAKQLAEAPAMYVAPDLEHWTTDEPHIWADKVTIHGKKFTRLTPASLTLFRKRIAKAETACAVGKLPLDAFGRIVDAFCPVYAFAVQVGMAPDLRANGGPASRDNASATFTTTRNA